MGTGAVTRAPNPGTVVVMRAAAALALACAACGPSAYACTEDGQCAIDALLGVCQADGFCSFPDDDCPSGQRYGEHGGPVGGQCVPVADGTSSSGGVGTTDDTLASLDGSTTAPTRETTSAGGTSDATATTDASATTSTGDPVDLEPLLWFAFDDANVGGVPNLGSLGGVAACTDLSCPSSTAGVVGTGAQFDGVDDCAIFPADPALAQLDALTLTAWLLREPTPGYDCILCKPVGIEPWNSWRLATYDDADDIAVGDFRVGTADDTGVSLASPIPTASWAHLVGTWDGATMVLWIDGVVAQQSPNTSYEVDDQPVFLGCDDDHDIIGITNFLTGSIDEVRLYGRVLGDDEIAELYAQGMAPAQAEGARLTPDRGPRSPGSTR